jgi:hypothetical protein
MTTHLGAAFATIPWGCVGFVVLAVLVSAYHGYRGYVLQRVTAQSQQNVFERQPPTPGIPDRWFWSDREVKVVRTGYDALFYDFCSVVGFAALWLASFLLNTMPNLHNIPGGTSAFLVFLVVLGLLGVSGQLPYLIQLGKVPK